MSQKRLDWDPETGPEGKDTVCSSTPSLQFCELVRVRRQPPEPLDGQKRGGHWGLLFFPLFMFSRCTVQALRREEWKGTEEFPSLSLVQPLLFHCVVWFFLFFFFKPDRNPPVLVPSSACSPDAWRGLEGDGELI